MDNTQQLLACLKPVESSMFSKAGYSEDYWTLVLAFKSSKEIKAYKNCAPEVADEALSSPSLGKWWNANIKGNPAWEAENIGMIEVPAKEPKEPKVSKAKPEPGKTGITDEDIRLAEPGWTGTTVLSTDHIHKEYGGIQRGPVDIKDTGEGPAWPELPQIPEEAFQYVEAVNKDAEILTGATALTKQTEGEILGKWEAPGSAAEALDLLSERATEIAAIIAQSKSTGEQALTVRVTDEASYKQASETLSKLVAKKDTTTALLEPFRAVLYSAYEEAAGYKKAALTPLETGEKHIKGQIVTWKNEQERIRQQKIREENERRDAEARRLQEEETARIHLADVQDKIDEGDEKGAQLLFEAPPVQAPRPYIAPTFIPPAATKVENQSSSTTWKVDRDAVESDETGQAYIASITALLKAVKTGAYPIEQAAPLLSWDFAAADKLAGALMAAFAVPGLSAAPATTLRVSRGRKKKQ